MKEVIPLLLALLIMLTSTCFAAYTPDPNRWTWLTSTDAVGVFYDRETLSYSTQKKSVEVWVCYVYPQKKQHTKINYRIYDDRTYDVYDTIVYNDKTGETIDSDYPRRYEQTIIPSSLEEDLYTHFFPTRT